MQNTGHYVATTGVSVRVQELTARNLHLLQAIESTLSVLDSDTNLLGAVTGAFHEIAERLQKEVPEQKIDAQGRACNALSLAADSVRRMHARATEQHKSACDDPRLTQEDGVARAYESYIEGLEHAFDAIQSLKDWIENHDALLEPALEGTFTSVGDLFAAMGIQH